MFCIGFAVVGYNFSILSLNRSRAEFAQVRELLVPNTWRCCSYIQKRSLVLGRHRTLKQPLTGSGTCTCKNNESISAVGAIGPSQNLNIVSNKPCSRASPDGVANTILYRSCLEVATSDYISIYWLSMQTLLVLLHSESLQQWVKHSWPKDELYLFGRFFSGSLHSIPTSFRSSFDFLVLSSIFCAGLSIFDSLKTIILENRLLCSLFLDIVRRPHIYCEGELKTILSFLSSWVHLLPAILSVTTVFGLVTSCLHFDWWIKLLDHFWGEHMCSACCQRSVLRLELSEEARNFVTLVDCCYASVNCPVALVLSIFWD